VKCGASSVDPCVRPSFSTKSLLEWVHERQLQEAKKAFLLDCMTIEKYIWIIKYNNMQLRNESHDLLICFLYCYKYVCAFLDSLQSGMCITISSFTERRDFQICLTAERKYSTSEVYAYIICKCSCQILHQLKEAKNTAISYLVEYYYSAC
jgi:hypothetical protein